MFRILLRCRLEEQAFQVGLAIGPLPPQLVDRARKPQPAAVDDRDAIGDLLGDAQGVGRHENRRPGRGPLAEQVLDQAGAFRIESDHRLIEHQDRRIVEQGRGEDQPLPHAVRIGFGQVVEEVAESEQLRLAGDP